MGHNDITEIKSITFGIFSPEEITKMSVCKIDETSMTTPPPNQLKVNDNAMQNKYSNKLCKKHENTHQMELRREVTSMIN